jgi:heptosyltransferase I
MTVPNASRILIIRPTALGDVSRTVPCLVALRKAHPNATIDWLVHDAFGDAVRYHPDLRTVIPFARGRFSQAWRSPSSLKDMVVWLKSLRSVRYDLVVDLQGLFRSGFFTRVTGAKHRLGYANAREMGWIFYNQKHKIDPNLHAVDRMLGLLAAAGYETSGNPDAMRLYTSAQDRAWAESELISKKFALQGNYFVIAPTAKWLCKCWPVERFAEITRRLLESGQFGKGGVILAAPSEKPVVDRLISLVNMPGRPLIAPVTKVGQMMALIEKSSLIVCNDSAPLHIAVGFNRPLVTIFGPTDPRLVGPYKREDTIVQAPGAKTLEKFDYRGQKDDQTLISEVTIDMVWDKIVQTPPTH